jgi:hypothetical protein
MFTVVFDAVAAEVWPERSLDPTFRAGLQASVRHNVDAALRMWAGESSPSEVRPPGGFALTDLLAELGVPISEVEAAYWVGSSRAWQEWFTIAQAAAEAGEGTIAEFIEPQTQLMFRYLINLLALVVERYESVAAEIRRSRDDRRRALVAQLVDGAPLPAVDELERDLGYRLAGTHLALALHVVGRHAAEALAAHLAATARARGSLLILHAPGLWLLWLNLAAPPTGEAGAALEAALAAEGTPAAVGEPAAGLPGFLQTRSDALEVVELRRRGAALPPVVWFRQVRLETLLMKDDAAARRFVTDELGELATGGERIDRARDTLLEWLITGSASQTAARLNAHENTIRARIAQAEQMLPNDLRARRGEVIAALRLRALLGDSPV